MRRMDGRRKKLLRRFGVTGVDVVDVNDGDGREEWMMERAFNRLT